MDKELKNLLDKIEEFQNDSDVNYDLFDKVEGDIKLGSKIEIYWKDREEQDKGYLFQLPNQEEEDYDLLVHVNDVDNSDGMDEAPDQYLHLYTLVSLEGVEKIKIVK